jgi:hypothetical protein
MTCQYETKINFNGEPVRVLGPTFDPGKPAGEDAGRWRQKLENRREMLQYLATSERYWYSREWYGSEKRRTPA